MWSGGRDDRMKSEQVLRVIPDKARDGAMNMAIDQALLELAEEGEIPPTLRFYRWNVPTISLGYFQKASEIEDQSKNIRSMPFVRRPTGGGAILHDDEITYSLTLPFSAFPEPVAIEAMYRIIHDAFISTLAGMGIEIFYRGGKDPEHSVGGPFFCFARAYSLDLTLAGDKLLGSAQRRLKKAAMQHGSFILGRTHTEQPSAELKAHLSGDFSEHGFVLKVAEEVAGQLGLTVSETGLEQAELIKAEDLTGVYASDGWNRKR